MSDAYPVACRATLMYAQDRPCFKHEKPYSVLSYLKDGATTTNLVWEHGEEEVFYNLRQSSEQVELDKHGFCFCVAPTEFADWGSRQRVEENYLPEVENILKREVSGADEVQIFDWRRRSPSKKGSGKFPDMNDPSDPLGPALQVHLDQSPAGLLKRVKLMTGSRAKFLLQGRIRIVK